MTFTDSQLKNEKDFGIETRSNTSTLNYDVCIAERYLGTSQTSAGILGKEREPGVAKLDWHGNFDTEFDKEYYFVISF